MPSRLARSEGANHEVPTQVPAPTMQPQCNRTAATMPVSQWTGREATALQTALRLTNEGFAGRLGVAVRTVAGWNAKPELRPRSEMQQALDTLLDRASSTEVSRFRDNLASGEHDQSAQVLRAAIAIVVKDQEVLLVCRRVEDAAPLRWQFPAGIVKPGGSAERTAERETLAETGVRCSVTAHLGTRLHPLTRVFCDYLMCDYLTGEPENLDPVENLDVTWVRIARLSKFIPLDAIYSPVLTVLRGSTHDI